ncbi:MFS transporter [Pseudonocardia benzenivorans]|uniref:MFS transporter n=1 Tax=Pseudonocardia benzenivorans TaxID=228005 RepID=A0ABW3VTA2_9PSEU
MTAGAATRDGVGSRAAGRAGRTLAAVSVVQFTVSLDVSVVNVGLPRIADGLGFDPVGLTWVVHAYALTFGGLLLMGGTLADRWGRRRVLRAGLVLFGVAALLGGLAQAPWELVAARALQGVGAAAMAPAALAALSATFPSGRARVRAFGVWSAVNAAGGAVGVLAGGLLTQYAGWRWVMEVNVPMVAVALVLAWGADGDPGRVDGVPGPADGAPARGGRPDVRGAVLATAGLSLLVFGVVRTEALGWASATTLATLAGAAALLVAFVHVERTTRTPLLPPGLLADRSVAGADVYNLLVGAAMASAFYLVSLYLQRVVGAGPALTGVEFVPFASGVVVGSVAAVRLGRRFAPRTLLVAGGLLTAAGFAWFGRISPDGGFTTDVLGPSIVASIGFGLCLGPVVSTATAGVGPRAAGVASGLLTSSRQIGASLGLAVVGTLAQARTGPRSTPAALTDGYALGLTVAAALLVGAVVVALTVLPRTGPAPGHDTVGTGGAGP